MVALSNRRAMHYSIAVCCDCTRHFPLATYPAQRTGICVERESMNLINIDDRELRAPNECFIGFDFTRDAK